jgi:hypothetical protein
MAFQFKLEDEDGQPADPPTLRSAVPNWQAGDMIPFGPNKSLRVLDVKPGDDADDHAVLVVEDAAE